MLIFWRIRYFDRTDKSFKDRDLFLDTVTLPPALRAAVELLAESKNNRNEREFLKFKSMFREQRPSDLDEGLIKYSGGINGFVLHDYFEDEEGNGNTTFVARIFIKLDARTRRE